MIQQKFDAITRSDIDSLIANAVRESKTLEYKQELPGGRDDDKKEFLSDVSSFANASGGDLLYGIREARSDGRSTGLPEAAEGLPNINVDQEIQRLENMIRTGIEPRMPGVQIRAIDGFSQGAIIIVRIPKSWAAPHMVSYKASPRFFSRTSAGKAPLDVAEIKAAFVQSEALPEKIRRFREERLGNILAGETPVPLSQTSLIVLHLIPISAFLSPSPVDVVAFDQGRRYLPPMVGASYSSRLNLDGFVAYTGPALVDQPLGDYVQLFRNGVIEAVDCALGTLNNQGDAYIPCVGFEEEIIRGATTYFTAYQEVGVEAPVLVMLSLLHVRGYYMYTGPGMSSFNRIDKQHLILPEIAIEDLSLPPEKSLRPMFDLVWQACGHRRSFNYDESGDWNPRQ